MDDEHIKKCWLNKTKSRNLTIEKGCFFTASVATIGVAFQNAIVNYYSADYTSLAGHIIPVGLGVVGGILLYGSVAIKNPYVTEESKLLDKEYKKYKKLNKKR